MSKKIKSLSSKPQNLKLAFLTLLSGNILSQVILFVATPILTRMYTPESFGVLGTFMAVISVLLTFSVFSLDRVIPLVKNEKLAVNALSAGLIFLLAFTSFLVILFIFIGDFIFELLNISTITKYSLLLPISIFGAGVYQLFNFYLVRIQIYKGISISKVTQSISQVSIQIVLALILGSNSLWLIIGDSIGRFSGSFRLVKEFYENRNMLVKKNVSIKKMKLIFLRNKIFLFQTTNSNFFNTLSLQTPLLSIGFLYGPIYTGLYLISQKIIGLPILMISRSVGQMFYGQMAKMHRENPRAMQSIYKRYVLKIFKLSVIPFIILFFFAESLVTLILGSGWEEAGEFLKILTPMFFTQLCITPFGQTLIIIKRSNSMQIWEMARFGTLLIGLIITAILNLEIKIFIYVISSILTCYYISFHILILFYLNEKKSLK